MEEALLAFLLADAAFSAACAKRLSWSWRDQSDPVPAATLTRTDGARSVTLKGYDGFVDGYVQLDCYAALQKDATTLARAAVKALGGCNEAATGGVIQGVFVEHDNASFEGEKPERIFRERLSLRVPHAEV